MDGKDFTGTITPTEARITIFEDVLGFTQADLAGITLGYNRGRTVTFKLRQQFDIDDLYEWEYFNFERSVGGDVSFMSGDLTGLCLYMLCISVWENCYNIGLWINIISRSVDLLSTEL